MQRSAPEINVPDPDYGGLIDWPTFRIPDTSDLIKAPPVNWAAALLAWCVIGAVACLVGFAMHLL